MVVFYLIILSLQQCGMLVTKEKRLKKKKKRKTCIWWHFSKVANYENIFSNIFNLGYSKVSNYENIFNLDCIY